MVLARLRGVKEAGEVRGRDGETGETGGRGETAQLVKNLSRKRERDLHSVLEGGCFTFIFYIHTQLMC